jgi:osmoprotectant transport system ATP-binding protein
MPSNVPFTRSKTGPNPKLATIRVMAGAMIRPMIRLEQVSKVFPGGGGAAVTKLSLEIGQGEVAVLVGPSGCGKTTTLRMINRLVEPTSGRIVVDGRDVATVEPHELRRRIGYVIQQVGLFGHRTVGDNVATVPRLLGWEKARIDARIRELMELVSLDPSLAARYPGELSGGQQQRVGVARALAADPPVLLMDEPFGAVDPIVRERLQDELVALQSRLHKTIVFVTHDVDEAIKLGDRVVVMNVGGIIEQAAPPAELLARPANDFVKQFVGARRGLRRLTLIKVTDVDLEQRSGSPLKLGTEDTLLDALDAMLREHVTEAEVRDNGTYLGTLTMDRISREVR